MIKANELRIDNWVKSNLNPTPLYLRVTALPLGRQHSEWQIEANYGDYNFEDLEPIPLTPEILEKAGFVKSYNYDNDRYLKSNDGDLYISNNPDDAYYIEQSEIYPNFSINSVDYGCLSYIEYVHQLQNLYFALTGQELEINL